MGDDNTNPVKHEIIRDEEGKFLPGVSGNPFGRPKKGLTLTDIAKEILEEELPSGVTRKEALMRQVAKLAYDGNENMIKLMWNYVDGMPRQSVEMSTPEDKQLTIKIVEDTTLKDANTGTRDTTKDQELPSAGTDILEPS